MTSGVDLVLLSEMNLTEKIIDISLIIALVRAAQNGDPFSSVDANRAWFANEVGCFHSCGGPRTKLTYPGSGRSAKSSNANVK